MTMKFISKHPSHPLAQVQAYQLEQEQKLTGELLFSSDFNKSAAQAAAVVGALAALMRDEQRLDVQKGICAHAFITAVGVSTVRNIDLAVSCKHPFRGYMDQKLVFYCQRAAGPHRRAKITRERFEKFAQDTLTRWAGDLSLGSLARDDQKLYRLVYGVRKTGEAIDPRTFIDQSIKTAVTNLCTVFGMLQVPDLQVRIKGVKNPSFDPEGFYKDQLGQYLQDPLVKSIFAMPS